MQAGRRSWHASGLRGRSEEPGLELHRAAACARRVHYLDGVGADVGGAVTEVWMLYLNVVSQPAQEVGVFLSMSEAMDYAKAHELVGHCFVRIVAARGALAKLVEGAQK